MRFARTVVSGHRFRDPTHTAERLDLLRHLLPRLAADSVLLGILPAGYLTVAEEGDVISAMVAVADVVEEAGIAVIGGVDVDVETGKASVSFDSLVRAGRLPYFGFAAFPTRVSPEVPVWRQASSTAANADLAPDASLPGRDRVVRVGDRDVGVLVCGELFSRRARTAVAELRPSLVVDLGHAGMGQGLIPAMASLAREAECPVAHAQHLAGWWGRSLHFVSAVGEQDSLPTDGSPTVGDDEFWIGWRVHEV